MTTMVVGQNDTLKLIKEEKKEPCSNVGSIKTDEELKTCFPAIKKIEYKKKSRNGVRKYYHFDYNKKGAKDCTHQNLFTFYKDLLALNSCDSLVLKDSAHYRKKPHKEYDGFYSYDYLYKGLPVKNSIVGLNMYEGRVKRLVLGIKQPPTELELTPSLSHEEAKK